MGCRAAWGRGRGGGFIVQGGKDVGESGHESEHEGPRKRGGPGGGGEGASLPV